MPPGEADNFLGSHQSTALMGGQLGSPSKHRFDGRHGAGWSSPVARQAHNLKVTGSNPVPATNTTETPPS